MGQSSIPQRIGVCYDLGDPLMNRTWTPSSESQGSIKWRDEEINTSSQEARGRRGHSRARSGGWGDTATSPIRVTSEHRGHEGKGIISKKGKNKATSGRGESTWLSSIPWDLHSLPASTPQDSSKHCQPFHASYSVSSPLLSGLPTIPLTSLSRVSLSASPVNKVRRWTFDLTNGHIAWMAMFQSPKRLLYR